MKDKHVNVPITYNSEQSPNYESIKKNEAQCSSDFVFAYDIYANT